MMKNIFFQIFSILAVLIICYSPLSGQCTSGCDIVVDSDDGSFYNLNGNQTLCITVDVSTISINMNGTGNVICVAPGVTWTPNAPFGFALGGGNELNLHGTFNLSSNFQVNGNAPFDFNIQPGGIANIGGTSFGNNLTINNDGELNLTAAAQINASGSFTLNNSADGVVNAMATTNFLMGNGTNIINDGEMNFANAELEEGNMEINDGAILTVSRSFDIHGNFIITPNAEFYLPCDPLPGAAGMTTCSFRVGDKGSGKVFENNSCCFEINTDANFEGATFNNGTIIISNGDLSIGKPSMGTGGHIVLTNGVSTILNPGTYAGTNLTFCDQDTPGNSFDNIFSANPANNMFTVDCTVTTSCCGGSACTDPTATAAITDVTCTGSSSNENGTITISGFNTGERYDFTTGATYTGSATFAAGSTEIPAGGEIVNNLPNPTGSQDYTVRIFNSDECYVDRTVTLNETSCACIVNASVIAGDQSICSGEDPAAFTVTTPATGNGTLTYQWQSSTTDCMTGFSDIATNGTSDTYDAPSGLTDTTYYRVITTSGGICSDTSNCITVAINACDWGDLPDTSAITTASDYQTISANNGPVHIINPAITLGSTIDGEIDGQPSTDALGDGADEDGLVIFKSLDISPGSTFRLPLSYTNTTGSPAQIEAWIDWNNNGEFDAGEMVLDVTDPNAGLYDRLEVTVPNDAVTGEYLGLRIRISNQDDMTPYGLVNEGEVEDYLIGIECATQICIPLQTTIIRN